MTVGVVGSGVTGLALVHHLRERGVDAVAFEATDRPGGVVRTIEREGLVLELGPQRVRLSEPLEELVSDLGLADELVVADESLPLYVYAHGRLRRVPMSVGAFLTTDLLSWPGKLRVLAEPLTAPGDPDESAAELFTRKFGREAYENVVGPLFGGIYGSDPARMPVRHALSNLLAMEEREGSLLRPALRRARQGGSSAPAVSFDDGVERLPGALYEAHADRIELSTPVRDVRATGDGFELATGDGEVSVEEVVLTTPADETAGLLSGLATGADGLRELRYNPLAVVHLRADLDREGMGYQVRHAEPLRTLGVSWNASLFDRDGVYTCFLGGMKHPELVEESEERLGEIASEEFERVTGAGARVVEVTRLDCGFPAYDESWAALDGLSLPDGVHLATNYTERMGVPSRVRQARTLADELAARTGSAGDASSGTGEGDAARAGDD